MKIVLIDSGKGGLEVLKRVVSVHPKHKYIFVCDSVNFPYGNKSRDFLVSNFKRILEVIPKPDLTIVACNTLSIALRNSVDRTILLMPDFYVESLLLVDKSKTIGVIGTSYTIESGFYQEKLRKLGFNKICAMSIPELVYDIETKEQVDVKKYLSNFSVDILVPATTHLLRVHNQLLNMYSIVIDPTITLIKALNKLLDANEKQEIFILKSTDLGFEVSDIEAF